MPGLIRRPVTVTLRGGRPSAFRDPRSGGRRTVARVLDRWREAGAWWAGDPERTVWRVQLEDGGICELEFDHGAGRWALYKMYD